jgi:hypothetical protein
LKLAAYSSSAPSGREQIALKFAEQGKTYHFPAIEPLENMAAQSSLSELLGTPSFQFV